MVLGRANERPSASRRPASPRLERADERPSAWMKLQQQHEKLATKLLKCTQQNKRTRATRCTLVMVTSRSKYQIQYPIQSRKDFGFQIQMVRDPLIRERWRSEASRVSKNLLATLDEHLGTAPNAWPQMRPPRLNARQDINCPRLPTKNE